MKKLITLALALVLVLGLAAPAMAFTTSEYDDSTTPYEVDIMLVDYTEGFVSSYVFNLPETNRGYLVNEVVCAIASVYLPKGSDPVDDGYNTLVFGGENANVYVTDNMRSDSSILSLYALLTNAYNAKVGVWAGEYSNGQANNTLEMYLEGNVLGGSTITNATPSINSNLVYLAGNRDYTFNVAFFAKVTADDASVNVTLKKSGSFQANHDGAGGAVMGNFIDFNNTYTFSYNGQNPYGVTGTKSEVDAIKIGDYLVFYHQKEMVYDVAGGAKGSASAYQALNDGHTGGVFTFTNYTTDANGRYKADKALFSITVNSNWRTKNVYFYDYIADNTVDDLFWGAQAYAAVASSFGTAGVSFSDTVTGQALTPGVTPSTHAQYPALQRLLALYNTDFKANWSFDIAAQGNVMKKSYFTDSVSDSIYDEVAIEPWYATIEVPDEIVIDAPKTGDALNVFGFVMIALCGLAVVAVKKVRA